VAILTLEVFGVPETIEDREHPWPSPEFIPAATGHLFEVRQLNERNKDFYTFLTPPFRLPRFVFSRIAKLNSLFRRLYIKQD
jgi:hypothetical protein